MRKSLTKSTGKKLWGLLFLLMLLLLAAAVGCNGEEKPAETEKITVTLDWTPNTNHTGLYVAVENGYFAEEGLEVEISQLSSGSVEQLVGSGNSHFGFSYQESVTFARIEEIPIVSLAAVIQHNTSGFASLKEKGIETPADFAGKRYGGWGSPIEETTIRYLMEKYDTPFEDVEILTTGVVDFFAAAEREADFSWIFYGWDGIAAELKGVELNYIELREEDSVFDYYTPVIVAGESLIEENPDLANKFMNALSKGYQFAINEPGEAAEILLKHAPELEQDLVIASQEWLKDKYQADAPRWGWQDSTVWEEYSRWLYSQELIEEEPDAEAAFTNNYLPAE